MNKSMRNFQFDQNLSKKKKKKKTPKKYLDLLNRDHFCNLFIKFVFYILLQSKSSVDDNTIQTTSCK